MQISRARRQRTAGGFATIEVLVAVAIIMMVGTVAVLTLGNTDRRLVLRETADTALFLQEARLRALELGRPIEIAVAGQEGLIDAGGHQHRFARGLLVTPQEARLVLHPTGQSDGLALSFAKGDQVGTVTLDWLTGRVSTE